MNAKRMLTAIALSLTVVVWAFAEELTAEQKRFRSEIQQFLKEEGFMPTIDNDDNSLNFKKEGTAYWLTFGGSGSIYLEFHRAGLKIEDADRNLVLKSANEANRKVRCAKAMVGDKFVSFAVEMYCHTAEDFKYVFYKCLSELETIKTEVSDYYNDNDVLSNSGSGSSSQGNAGKFDMSQLFPVYGVTLGKTKFGVLESQGYEVEDLTSDRLYCYVKGIGFSGDKGDKIIDGALIVRSSEMPDLWVSKAGINWSMSYNQIIEKLKKLGLKVTIVDAPKVETYNNRKTLTARVDASSLDGKFEMTFKFEEGNENGEGYTVNSINTLDYIRIAYKK